MKSVIKAGLTAALWVFASCAQAATLSAPYSGEYDATSVNTNGNLHTIWLSGVPGSDYFQFVADSGRFSWPGAGAGDSATLTGTIAQNGNAANRFDV